MQSKKSKLNAKIKDPQQQKKRSKSPATKKYLKRNQSLKGKRISDFFTTAIQSDCYNNNNNNNTNSNTKDASASESNSKVMKSQVNNVDPTTTLQ